MPYLKQLGISHVYASPLLKARAGSNHGYDTTDHQTLNPELGTWEDFLHFSNTLQAHGLGLIVDIVPNHMATGSANAWWMDVLENGPASPFARYFDIDWAPAKEELVGKVLLPVLGDHYGDVLERGELQLKLLPEAGQFQLHYWDHVFPINPVSYPQILQHRLDVLRSRLIQNEADPSSPNVGSSHSGSLSTLDEYLSIATAFARLPVHQEAKRSRLDERIREKRVACKRLAALCQQEPIIVSFLEENLKELNEGVGDIPRRKRLHRLLDGQAYRLAYWRTAQDEINYRRFFDVNDLVGLRQEDARVFRDTHRLVVQLMKEGRIQGLRIDHPDGLFQPVQYFRKLQEVAADALKWPVWDWHQNSNERALGSAHLPLYVVAEKILAPHEQLPSDWMVHGTTGYDFCSALGGLFVERSRESEMTKAYQRFTGWRQPFESLITECKLLIMQTALASELTVLAQQLNRISETRLKYRDFTYNKLLQALTQVVACFPVYRTYALQSRGKPFISARDKDMIRWALGLARRRTQAFEQSIFDFIEECLTLNFKPEHPSEYRQAVLAFVQKFQQYTGPLMAKGLEDTAFYRYNRLIALNEVGGEPNHYGLDVQAFHLKNKYRSEKTPFSMLCTSTHDTKRSEDVRARLVVLSELPTLWLKTQMQWSKLNRFRKTTLNDGQWAPDRNDESLIYQTLVGLWPNTPPDEATHSQLVERMQGYLMKALREAKVHTSWVNPNEAYEQAVSSFIEGILAPGSPFVTSLQGVVQDLAPLGYLNSLSQTLLKLTSPGIPDIYQGNESLDFSLVDPDNRRPVDYPALRARLAELKLSTEQPAVSSPQAGTFSSSWSELWQAQDFSGLKLQLSAQVLNWRKQYPDLFLRGRYEALEVTGPKAEHLVAYLRRFQGQQLLVLAPRCLYWSHNGQNASLKALSGEFWAETFVQLPLAANQEPSPSEQKDEPTAETYWDGLQGRSLTLESSAQRIEVATLLDSCPFGLFLKTEPVKD